MKPTEWRGWVVGALLVLLGPATRAAAGTPGYAPLPGSRWLAPSWDSETRWYGWQTMLVTGGFAALGVASAPSARLSGAGIPLGIGGVLLGGPLVHAANGHVGKGLAVLGMNVGMTLAGAALGGALACSAGGGCRGDFGALRALGGGVLGCGAGALTAVIIDVAALSYDEPPRGRTSITLVPRIDVWRNRAVLGVSGRF